MTPEPPCIRDLVTTSSQTDRQTDRNTPARSGDDPVRPSFATSPPPRDLPATSPREDGGEARAGCGPGALDRLGRGLSNGLQLRRL